MVGIYFDLPPHPPPELKTLTKNAIHLFTFYVNKII